MELEEPEEGGMVGREEEEEDPEAEVLVVVNKISRVGRSSARN